MSPLYLSKVYIGLGSNLPDRLAHLRRALEILEAAPLCADPRSAGGQDATPLRVALRIARVSSVYESAPFGPVRQQPDFLNAVAEVVTTLTPHRLLERLLDVESAMGRKRELAKGPRNIDLDLLLFGGEILAEPHLTLPHPGLTERAFVLGPLLEIAPNLTDPRDGRSLRDQMERLGADQSLRIVGPPALLRAPL